MSQQRWVRALALADFPAKNIIGLPIEGKRYVFCRVGDAIYAADDACTHQFARLSEGELEDCLIECPVHYARFDMRTGVRTYGPVNRDLQTYPTKLDEGQIYIALPD
jgi:nitrite reductase/ring-hydroxylating ferredoxin subunit